MIQELSQTHYLGVRCTRCKEPIAVPKRVAILFEELRHADEDDHRDVRVRAMTLRCKACDEEGIYGLGQTQEFEGSARIRHEKRKIARA
jgi:hypothetical protein